MACKYSFDEVKKEFADRGYTLLSSESEFVNVASKLRYICPKHSDKGEMKIGYHHLKTGRGCYYCGREKVEEARRTGININEAKDLCQKHGFEFVNMYRENNVLFIEFICEKHMELGIQKMRKGNMKRDIKGCKYCHNMELPEWYVKKILSEKAPDVELLEPYINYTSRIKYRCKKHDYTSHTTVQSILNGHVCYHCGLEKLSKQNLISQDEYEQRVFKVNPDVKVVEKYTGMENKVKFQCKKCKHIWESSSVSMINNATTCPNCCHVYKGEQIISQLLVEWGYNFETQHKFDDCINKKHLRFDFYLPDFKTCIEFDGRQHFKPVFGQENLEKTKANDIIKNEYCLKNDIKLIRIPFWEFKNIECYLFDKLCEEGIIEKVI